ncbi:MAG: NAD(P)/FAD-dependent oxidoreductase [Hoeflea sp.]|uniref:phytoene desaturase family protein n=1 Tax=Hoeflea sp. TaxID=1940281 RepID=UPI001E0E64BC|nr:NAD(P)/FAD-dependent oxidoreductase [Hoeflea sp.]MBU4528738.1 NAD(P)/FAD-dependent oxidoreductase [Alphaproteobacteria bacterium]MBU4545935.1 NAD(P)/FAD-dependent oxidoreductase [Alphaproteobacteria bacterium]MBU4549872.1 NAD(P)/FAD-dependent oxidoreductase [Alphaproteobacteria bacterium]MBV1725869.1 NAD(P)/FAD-dependent oxidoreductase [Hoeflea sp.]MBV1762594.1 NAD(P)/FAD-dependent oxidoreductase [Hoeflea sp.]
MADFDHIIVGSGINALVAAAMLSKKGKRVLVLEREDRFGGCMRTDEITLPGFHHDVMAATFVLFLTSPSHAALGADLARHGLEFCHTPHPTAVLRPDGTSLVLCTDRAANIETFNALAGGDGDRHGADVGAIEADAPFLFALLGGELWSWPTAKLLAGQAWKRGPRGLAAWMGEALRPTRAWLESSYSSELVQALWAPWALHTGLTTESAYGAQMGKVIAFALEAAGAPVIKGGAGRAADTFKALIEENGGELRAGADVDQIRTHNGKASGVRLADGTEISASHVICSVAPGQLYGRLLRDTAKGVSDEKAKDLQHFRHGRGNFQLHYAIDGPVRWKTAGLEDVALIHLADSIDSVSKSSNEAERGMLPATPTICVGQPHRLDPTRCPEGKSILWLQIPDAPRTLKGDASGLIATDGSWTEAVREAFANRIEATLANHIEGFSETVLARKAYSPADLESMNINLVGGDPYGGSCALDQFFIWRPFAGSKNHTTAINNLHHIGASTHPGPGLGGGSGFLLAKRLGT